MFVDRKPFIYVWRPTYWLLATIRTFFSADIRRDVHGMHDRLCACESGISQLADRLTLVGRQMQDVQTAIHNLQTSLVDAQQSSNSQISEVRNCVNSIGSDAHRQWEALERLLLCLLSEPAPRFDTDATVRRYEPGVQHPEL